MRKIFKKKTIWEKKETRENLKETKNISALRKYKDVYDDLLEYKKVIAF